VTGCRAGRQVPSLWTYTQQLGGTRTTYGIAGSGAFLSAVIMLPIFGYLGDRAAVPAPGAPQRAAASQHSAARS
jgi:MFS family permease